MAKISNTTSYPTKENPLGTDYVIGTDEFSKETKTFTLQSIADLYAGSGGGGTPASPLNSVQFNNNGSFGGSSKLTYIDSTRTLSIGDQDVLSAVVDIAGGSGVAGQLRLGDGGASGNVVTLKAATDITSGNYDIVLPSVAPGGNNKILESDSSGNLSWINTPTGGGSPGGSDTQIQYNNGGVFEGTTGLTWDDSTNILSIATRFEGDINGALLQQVLVKEPGGVSKGDVVYISGGTGDNPEVRKAQSNSASTMSALGIMKANINEDAIGECVTSGEITGLNLSGFTTGDELFVSNNDAGALITSAPTGEANLIQKIAKVIKGGTGGALTVLGAFRTNATPNLNQGSIFIGNASNQASTLAIGANNYVLTSNGTTASWAEATSGGDVDSVTTTDGTYINLTPNSATTGAVTVTADLSALDGTSDASTRFLSKDNTWDLPTYAGHTIIDMADADTTTSNGAQNETYLMTTTVDSNFTAKAIKLQFELVPTTTTIEVAIYTYVEQGINSTTSNVRLGYGVATGSPASTTKRKVITLTADDGPGLALTAGTNYVVALRCVGGNSGSGVFAASGKLSNVNYAATIDGNPALPAGLVSGGEGNSFTATTLRPALTIY